MAPRLCQPVLQVKVAWEQDTEMVSEEGRMVGRGLLGVCSRGELNIWTEF